MWFAIINSAPAKKVLMRESALGGNLTAQIDIQQDKAVFTRLLNYITMGTRVEGRHLQLAENEELLRLIPVLCECFTREELIDLLGERLTGTMLDMHRAEMLQN